jgi:intein/homing endonuclease
VILDECFVSGTKINTPDGYKNIEEIKKGDIVFNAIGEGIVVDTFSQIKNKIIKIKLNNGKVIKTTEEHPFFVIDKGWVPASLLMHNDMLYSKDEKKTHTTFLRDLSEADRAYDASWKKKWTIQKILQRKMFKSWSWPRYKKSLGKNDAKKKTGKIGKNIEKFFFTDRGKEKRISFSLLFKNEEKQPNEKFGNKKKGKYYFKTDGTQTESAWRKWSDYASATKDIIVSAWGGVVCRACSKNKWFTKLSKQLQNRYSKSKNKTCDRSGWWITRFTFKTERRQEKRKSFKYVRVESIEIQKQENIRVYNISVGGHPSYFVEDILVHNCHKTLSGLYPETRVRKGIRTPKMSQLFEITKFFLKEADPERLYLLSATPASKAMRVYAMALFFGKVWDYFAFRDKFYYEIKINSYSGRWVERKKPELKQQLVELIKSFGYVGSLQDWVDVPPQVHIEEYFEMSAEQKKEIIKLKSEESDPLVYTGKERAIQNGILYTYEITKENGVDNLKRVAKTFNNAKLDKILDLAEEFPRMLIFARYTAQIEMIEKALKKEGYDVVCLTGKTKDRKNVIIEADKRDCIVIAQSEICEGYELKTFRTTVFASKSAMAESYIQSLGRTLRIDALNKNLFIHLIAKGGADERCHKTILAGGDFQEMLTSKTGDIIEE